MPLFDRKDKSRYTAFTRRSLIAGGAMATVFGALGARLYQLQILDGSQFVTESAENAVNDRLISPSRGRILDRFAVELASNRRNFRVLLIPEQVTGGVEAALDAIAALVPIDARQRAKISRDIKQNKPFLPVTVVDNLSWDEFARINLHLPYLPGVQPDVGETRNYPFADELSHVVGYVAPASVEDKHHDEDPLLDLPGFRVGKRGIEKSFDKSVRGQAGVSRVEVNAYGRVIRELSREPATPGNDIYLTIDRDLQHFVHQRLGDQSATCVVMDAQNGDVLALVSTPGYDPNLFNAGIGSAQWHALVSDDHKPLLNKAIAGNYPPGSTFKTAMALAAADNGMADLVVNCTGSMRLGDHTFYCDAWRIGGHGHVDLPRGIQVSCDIFFYEVAKRLGIDKMAEAAHAIGLGSPTGIELPGEIGGFIPSRAWKLARFGTPWQRGETLINGIGQGYVLATPIQLCMLAARLATGKTVMPRLVHQAGAMLEPRLPPAPLPFSDKAFAMVREGMSMAVNAPGGTAYGWRIAQPGLEMAGKTGTAQIRRITKEERQHGLTPQSELPWKEREHALFIGFAPADNPRYTASIVVEHGGARNEPQVELARDILLFAQQRDPLRLPAAYPVASAAARRWRG